MPRNGCSLEEMGRVVPRDEAVGVLGWGKGTGNSARAPCGEVADMAAGTVAGTVAGTAMGTAVGFHSLYI